MYGFHPKVIHLGACFLLEVIKSSGAVPLLRATRRACRARGFAFGNPKTPLYGCKVVNSDYVCRLTVQLE